MIFVFYFLVILFKCYITDLIKKLDYFILIRIKFVQNQISVPKIGILLLKAACINPWKRTWNLAPILKTVQMVPENYSLTYMYHVCLTGLVT